MRAIYVLSALLLLLGGCSPAIVHSDSADAFVSNGIAYDMSTLSITPDQIVVLPRNAKVLRDARPGELHLYICKKLDYGGHPILPISIEGKRDHMGVAMKVDGSTLTLATFGEWDSEIEGGAYIKLIVSVAPGVPTQTLSDLQGEKSVCQDHSAQTSFWNPEPLQPVWKKGPDRPDPDFASRQFPPDTFPWEPNGNDNR